tara:strand:- start:6215 stop:6451 length:237 start_codon:yes stop_codon:yes gene_type:complete
MSGAGYFDYGDMSPDELFRSRNSGLQKLILAAETVEEETLLKPNERRVRIKWCVPIMPVPIMCPHNYHNYLMAWRLIE